MIFFIDIFGNDILKMSKIVRWVTFPYLYQGAILFSISSIIYYFRIQTTISS